MEEARAHLGGLELLEWPELPRQRERRGQVGAQCLPGIPGILRDSPGLRTSQGASGISWGSGTSHSSMALLLASEVYHVLGSVVTPEKVQLAQMGLYLVYPWVQKQLLT